MSKRRFTFFFKKKSWKSRIQSQEDLPSFTDCTAVPIQADAAQNNICRIKPVSSDINFWTEKRPATC
ncbi:hypothetical protein IMY05_001G0148400 [Salix suchowensis]|nr:hypothetical protein IMY05_001G0148400 [Salix suchowensis]